MNTWQNLTSDGGVRSLKYSFGFSTANTLAARLDDGGWLIVSPSCGTPDEVLGALEKEGPVRALVAPNAYHHLGQAAWRKRFPDAVSYAPEGALSRLAQKAAGVPFRPLGELRLPERVRVVVPDGMKTPDVLASVGTPEGVVWFSGDLISNTQATDMAFLARLGFTLLGGGMGYRFNRVPAMVYLKDKAAWKVSARAHFEAAPPAIVVPAHGDPVRTDAATRTREILA